MNRYRPAALVVCAALLAGYNSEGLTGDLLKPDVLAVTTLGQGIYKQHCAVCHGANREGQPNWRKRRPDGRLPAPPHDETGHTWHHLSQMLFEMTKHGVAKFAGEGYVSDMPAFQGALSDDEIIAALSFIKKQWPAEIRKRHDQFEAAAQSAKDDQ